MIKVVDNRNKQSMKFCELEIGDLFHSAFNKIICMKIPVSYSTSSDTFNCVILATGKTTFCELSSIISKINNATLTIDN